MTTFTLKINERTSMGKAILEFLKNTAKIEKSVEIIPTTNTKKNNPKNQESVYLLTAEEKKEIALAEKDIKAGRVMSAEQAHKMLEKYL